MRAKVEAAKSRPKVEDEFEWIATEKENMVVSFILYFHDFYGKAGRASTNGESAGF